MKPAAKTFSLISVCLIETVTGLTANENRNKGLELFYKKEYQTSVEYLEKYYSGNSDDTATALVYGEAMANVIKVQALISKAKSLAELSRFNAALGALDRAEAIQPSQSLIFDTKKEIEKQRQNNAPFAHLNSEEKLEYDLYLKRAREKLKNADLQGALDLYAKCLFLAPKSPDANEEYAQVIEGLGKKSNQKRYDELLSEAATLKAAGRLPQALARYDELLRFNPADKSLRKVREDILAVLNERQEERTREDMARTYLQTGNMLMNRAEYSGAIEQFQLGRGVQGKYTNWETLIENAKGRIKIQQKQDFEESLVNMQARFQNGIMSMTRENYQTAISDFETVVQIAKKYSQQETRNQAAELLSIARENLQIKEEETISPENPYFQLVSTLHAMGQRALSEKNYEKSREHYLSILELFPRNAIANHYLLSLNILQNPGSKEETIQNLIRNAEKTNEENPAEARRLLQLAQSIAPEDTRIARLTSEIKGPTQLTPVKNVNRADIEKRYQEATQKSATNPRQALDIIKSVVSDDPTFVRGRVLLARLEAILNENQWRREPDYINRNAENYYTKGIVLYNNGRIREARTLFEKALAAQPGFARAKNALAKCNSYLSSGKT